MTGGESRCRFRYKPMNFEIVAIRYIYQLVCKSESIIVFSNEEKSMMYVLLNTASIGLLRNIIYLIIPRDVK